MIKEILIMHKTSYLKMKWFKKKYLNTSKKLKILDVGSLDKKGDFNYSTLFNEKNWNYTGLDFEDGNNVDIVVDDIYNWLEVEDNTYDIIISGQFFQHLEYFWLTMSEIERVLKPGGYVCIITPAAGPKHVAHKKEYLQNIDETEDLESRIDTLESKIDLILQTIQK